MPLGVDEKTVSDANSETSVGSFFRKGSCLFPRLEGTRVKKYTLFNQMSIDEQLKIQEICSK